MNASDLVSLLACPACLEGGLRGDVPREGDGELTCDRCGATYPVRDGIPILLPPGFDVKHAHDELDHAYGAAHKGLQAGYYDRGVAEEFEIERPHGAPEAYRWLLGEKFRRSVALLPPLAGATVIDACCGSGMDAEMLARRGARVIAVDISEGCAIRARERARRRGLDYLVVVGDVEHLPVRTRAASIGYVHDGLHHLADPERGMRELARVSRDAVSITEPADAFGTAVAVRLGLALDRENAGNRVARLRPDAATELLQREGFHDVTPQRYFMYYPHEPGGVMRAVSHPLALPAYRGAARLADALIGRRGNKLQITARRRLAAAA
jgi:SAM-dependent methyltransferase